MQKVFTTILSPTASEMAVTAMDVARRAVALESECTALSVWRLQLVSFEDRHHGLAVLIRRGDDPCLYVGSHAECSRFLGG